MIVKEAFESKGNGKTERGNSKEEGRVSYNDLKIVGIVKEKEADKGLGKIEAYGHYNLRPVKLYTYMYI